MQKSDMLENGEFYRNGAVISYADVRTRLASQGYSRRDLIGLASGRMQPFHKGHERRLLEIMRSYEWTHVGIAVPDPKNTRLRGPRYSVSNNFLTYVERCEIVLSAVEELTAIVANETGRKPKVTVGPHFPLPTYSEEVFWNYVPGNFDVTIFHNTLKTDFDRDKLHAKRHLPRTVLLMTPNVSYGGSTIRSMMLSGNSTWETMVPAYAVEVIKRNECVERLRDSS